MCLNINQNKFVVTAPSNIALVKYWGKRDQQLPINQSVSFTLSNSVTSIDCEYEYSSAGLVLDFIFEGDNGLSSSSSSSSNSNSNFKTRVLKYLESLIPQYSFLNKLKLKIISKNSFPHSAGIASSASFYAALAKVIVLLKERITKQVCNLEDRLIETSYLARLGSGSASRSIYPGVVCWGESNLLKSSNEYATRIVDFHENFRDYADAILIVDDGVKSVSSSTGHQLMSNHPYKLQRIERANARSLALFEVLKSGDVKKFGEIVEAEALELHGLMMSSNPPYILLRPNSLNVIESIKKFREEESIPCCFTMDAGPNVHLLYPNSYHKAVSSFIERELAGKYILSWIEDKVCYEF